MGGVSYQNGVTANGFDGNAVEMLSRNNMSLVANNCQLSSNTYADTNPVNNNRTKHKSGPTGYRLKKVAYVNGYLITNGEVNGPFDYTLQSSVCIDGLYKRFKFNGQNSVTAAKEWGINIGEIDGGEIYVPPNTEFYIDTYREATDSASSVITITGITQANPCVVTYSGVDPTNGDTRRFVSVGGMTQLNYATNGNVSYKIRALDTTAKTFILTTTGDVDINSTGYSAYTSGGTAERVYSWHYGHVGTLVQGAGRIAFSNASKQNYQMGIGLPGGALPATVNPLTPTNMSGLGINTSTKNQVGSTGLSGVGAAYTSGLTLQHYYGAAGVNQAGSQYAATSSASGYTNNSGGLVNTITVSSAGANHDPENLPQGYLGGGGGYGAATQTVYGPACLMGIADDDAIPSVVLIGDSITAAMMSADSTGDIYGNFGCYEQAIANRCGVMKLAVNGESMTGWLQNYTKQMIFIDTMINAGIKFSSAVLALGTNDFSAYNYSDQDTRVAAMATSIIAILKTNNRFTKVFTTTVIPRVTGTYTTLAGQTAITVNDGTNPADTTNFGANGKVINYNIGIRNGTIVPTQDGYLDLAGVLRDSTDTYRFRVDGQFYLQYSTGVAFTTDGIHPNIGAGIPYAALNLDVRALGITDSSPRVRSSSLRIPRAFEVGQTIKSRVLSGSAVSLTTATRSNVITMQIPAGVWQLVGKIDYVMTGATVTDYSTSISQVSATPSNDTNTTINAANFVTITGTQSDSLCPPVTVVPQGKILTVYLSARATFSVGTVAAYGNLTATRIASFV